MSALQNKNHLMDSEIIFDFPTKISEIESFLTIESGLMSPTNLSTGAFAASVIPIDSNTTVSASVGRQNNLAGPERVLLNTLNSENFELSQSPVDLTWAYKNTGQIYAVGLFYSGHNDKLNQATESTQVLRAGYRSGFFTLSASLGLINDVVTATNKKLNIYDAASISLLYEIDALTLSAAVDNFSADQKNSGIEVSTIENQNIELAFSDRTDLNKTQFFKKISTK